MSTMPGRKYRNTATRYSLLNHLMSRGMKHTRRARDAPTHTFNQKAVFTKISTKRERCYAFLLLRSELVHELVQLRVLARAINIILIPGA